LEASFANFILDGILFENEKLHMRAIIAILLLCILFVLCWPLALIMIVLLPLLWLILLPFRIIGLTLDLVFRFIGAILMFPFRVIKSL
jgi:hypothetical protein